MSMAGDTELQRTSVRAALSHRKLEAFARIEADFVASFVFVQEVRGQRRFDEFPVAESARFLHALYICDAKDRLLSVPAMGDRYEGRRCLELLREWQAGRSADVVAFIHRHLDDQPFAELTRQIERATRAGDTARAQRLTSGRAVLLNRNFNLSVALDALFALAPERLRAETRAACKRLGHTPTAIERQLADLDSELYTYAPSPELARRNLLVMNRLVPHVMGARGDHPGERTDRVLPPASPSPSYAEERIPGERTLLSLRWRAAPRVEPAAPSASAQA
jgi:hypothetical protein